MALLKKQKKLNQIQRVVDLEEKRSKNDSGQYFRKVTIYKEN